MKKIILLTALSLLFTFGLTISAQGADFPMEPSVPGRTEGTGTYFEITDSEYLNVFLQSSQEITILLESVPKTISLHIEALTSANSTTLIIGGLETNKTYYKFEDSYKNRVEFITDNNGTYTYTQDLSQPHHIWIQPEDDGTVFLPEDCSTYGIWDEITSTCTLTQDLTESVEITANNITLNCDGHSIMGIATGYGIYLNKRTGIVIKDCIAAHFFQGIYLGGSSNNNTLTGNDISSNGLGILLHDSSSNTLIRNVVLNSQSDGIWLWNSSSNTLTENNASDNWHGIYLGGSSNDNTLTGNDVSNHELGILLYDSNSNTLLNNTVSNSQIDGIWLGDSSNNTLTDNNTSDNFIGINLNHSSDNTLTGNTTNLNNQYGIHLGSSNTNTLVDNTISNNNYGIFLDDCQNSKVHHNNFIDNSTQAGVYEGANNLFDDGYPDGGNYWSDYTGVDLYSGPNQDEPGSDGIGDTSYTFTGGQDRYPFMEENGWEVNQPPIFSDLNQYKSDGITVIDEVSTTTESTVIFKAVVSDPDNDQVKLEVELREFDEPFTGVYDSGILSSDFVDSGSEAVITRYGLVEGQYKWRARAVDTWEASSDWQEFGEVGNVDFEVKLPSELAKDVLGSGYLWAGKGWNRLDEKKFVEPQEIRDGYNYWNPCSPEVEKKIIDEEEYYCCKCYDSNPLHEGYQDDCIPHYIDERRKILKDEEDKLITCLEKKDYIDIEGKPKYRCKCKGKVELGKGLDCSGLSFWSYNKAYGAKKYKEKSAPYNPIHYEGADGQHWYNTIPIDEGELIPGDLLFFDTPRGGFLPKGSVDHVAMYVGDYYYSGGTIGEAYYPAGVYDCVETCDRRPARYYGIVPRTLEKKKFNEMYEDPGLKNDPYFIRFRRVTDPVVDGTAYTRSPVDLILTDPDGFTITKDIWEIPGVLYYSVYDIDEDGELDDMVTIPERKIGSYLIQVVPEPDALPTDTYSLEVEVLVNGELVTLVLAENVPISEIPNEGYGIRSTETTVEKMLSTKLVYSGDTSGQYSDTVSLSAVLTDEYDSILSGKAITFEIAEQSFSATTDEEGKVEVSWQVDLMPKELLETHPITVTFAGDEYYLPTHALNEFTLKSAKWLKASTIEKLEAAKTGHKIIDKEIDSIIKRIEKSLKDGYWIDASHLDPKYGKKVFHEEYKAVNHLKWKIKTYEKMIPKLEKIIEKKQKYCDECDKCKKCSKCKCKYKCRKCKCYKKEEEKLKAIKAVLPVFKEVISDLVKADEILAKIAIDEAKNTPVENPKFQKKVDHYIKKAEKELSRAEKELEKNRPTRAIKRFEKAWKYAQLAIKFAKFKKR